MTRENYQWDAFVSYRRSDGSPKAHWLRDQLKKYRLPDQIRSGTAPLRVYLDSAYEAATQDFFDSNIAPALRASRYLVVVSTPDALKPNRDGSPNWVVREIEFFRALPQGKNILIIIASGPFDQTLPADLEKHFPQIERVDIRDLSMLRFVVWTRIVRLGDEFRKLVAPLYDVTTAEMPVLYNEQKRAERKRFVTASALIAAVLFGLSAAGMYATIQASKAVQAEHTASIRSLEQRAASVGERFSEQRALIVLEALHRNRGETGNEPFLEQGLRDALLAFSGSIPLRHRGITALAVSPDGKWLATGAEDGSVLLWPLSANDPKPRRLGSHRSGIEMMSFSPDGRWLLTGCVYWSGLVNQHADGRAMLWRVDQSSPPITLLDDGQSEALEAAFTPDSAVMALRFSNGHVRIWRITNDRMEFASLLSVSAYAMRFSPDGQVFVLGNDDGAARVWSRNSALTAAAPLTILAGHDDAIVQRLTFSPDGRWLVTASYSGVSQGGSSRTMRLWSVGSDGVRDRATILAVRSTYQWVRGVTFSADSRWLSIRADTDDLRLWRMPTGSEPLRDFTLRASDDFITDAFSHNSRFIASGHRDGTVRLWQLDSLQPDPVVPELTMTRDDYRRGDKLGRATSRRFDLLQHNPPTVSASNMPHVLVGHADEVNQVAFSPDDRTLVSASNDWSIRQWDVDHPTSAPLVVRAHEGSVDWFQFVPPETLLTASFAARTSGGIGDESIRRYRLDSTSALLPVQAIVRIAASGYAHPMSNDGRWLAMMTAYQEITVVRVSGQPLVRTVPGECSESCFTSDSNWIVTRGRNALFITKTSSLMTTTLPLISKAESDANPLRNVEFANGRARVATYDGYGNLWVVDPAAPSPRVRRLLIPESVRKRLSNQSRFVVHFSPTGDNVLFTITRDKETAPRQEDPMGVVLYYDLGSGAGAVSPLELHVPGALPHSANFTADAMIVTTGRGSAAIWRHPYDGSLPTLLEGEGGLYPADYPNAFTSPDHGWLITLSRDSAILHNLHARDPERTRLVLAKGRPNSIAGYYAAFATVQFSRDSKWAVIVFKRDPYTKRDQGKGPLRTMTLVDLQASPPTVEALPFTNDDAFEVIRFSPDSRWLAAGGGEFASRVVEHTSILVWPLEKRSDREPIRLSGHNAAVADFEFSPEGRFLFSASRDRSVLKWDLRAADPINSFTWLQRESNVLALSSVKLFPQPDGESLITVTNSGRLLDGHFNVDRWWLREDSLRALARISVGRNFSHAEWRRYFGDIPYRLTFADLPVYSR